MRNNNIIGVIFGALRIIRVAMECFKVINRNLPKITWKRMKNSIKIRNSCRACMQSVLSVGLSDTKCSGS
jgi:hypothetical protein